jgi:hypothetical protein
LLISIDKSARVLDKPRVYKPNEMMTFQVKQTELNKFTCAFDCLNAGEWVTLSFFTTGNPRPVVSASARVNGIVTFHAKTDDGRAEWPERVASLLIVFLIVGWPVALIASIVWAYSSHYLEDILHFDLEKVPLLCRGLLGWGLIIPLLYAMYFGLNWVERRRTPKGYLIPADFPGHDTPVVSFFRTAIKGRREAASGSIHDRFEIVPVVDSPQKNLRSLDDS